MEAPALISRGVPLEKVGQNVRSGAKSRAIDCNTFVWEEEEVELVLARTVEYETKKAAEGVKWDVVRAKYSHFFEIF